jgi:hypothetical protein
MEQFSNSADEMLAAPADQWGKLAGTNDSIPVCEIKDANIPRREPDCVGGAACEPWLPQPRLCHHPILPSVIRND